MKRWILPVAAFLTVLAVGGGLFFYFYSDEPPKAESQVARATTLHGKLTLKAFPRVPRPPVFATKYIEPEIQASYDVAREVPELLEKLPCYCGCFQQGHSSNYDCFVDSHGAACEMCRSIALTAHKLRKAGQKDEQIVTEINERFAR